MIPDNDGCGTGLWRVDVFRTGKRGDLCPRVKGAGRVWMRAKHSNIASSGDRVMSHRVIR